MGQSSSSQLDQPSDELAALFAASELAALRRAFSSLAAENSGEAANVITKPLDALRLTAGVPWSALQQQMVDAEGAVRWNRFLEAIASVCKGRKSERAKAIAALYAGLDGSAASISRAAVKRLLMDAAIAACGGDASSAAVGEPVLDAVAAGVCLCGGGGGGAGGVTLEEWSDWIRTQLPSLPLCHELFLLHYLCALGGGAEGAGAAAAGGGGGRGGGSGGKALGGGAAGGRRRVELPKEALSPVEEPLLLPAEGQAAGSELLEPTGAWLLSLALGRPGAAALGEAPSWRCLYASRSMGLSMNRFNHHATGYAGPTMLLILTDRNELFGSYIDAPLKPSGKYIGGSGCVLFTLAPSFHVFRPTNISHNYVLFNPPQTGALATEAYLNSKSSSSSAPEVLGFGGQTARLRLTLEDDLKVLRWHHSCTTYAKHPEPAKHAPEGPRAVRALELWGCGGADAEAVQKALRERRVRDGAKAGKVDRAAMFGMAGDWRNEDNPDRMILETAGAHTFYSAQLEKLPPPGAEKKS